MNRRFSAISLVLLSLMLVALACGKADAPDTPVPTNTPVPATATPVPPTPTETPIPGLELRDKAFRNEASGYAIRYPQGWQSFYDEAMEADVLYDSNEPIEGVMDGDVAPTVPIVMVMSGPLRTLLYGDLDETRDAQDMLEIFTDWVDEVGEAEKVTVAGEPATAVNVSWSEDDVSWAGRAVAIHLGDRAIIIQGAGTAESWEPFVPTLEAMLASLTLFEPTMTFDLDEEFESDEGGYAILYPEDWETMDFDEGTVMLYASREAVEGAVPSIPIVLVAGGPIETVADGDVAGAQDAWEMIEAIADARREEGKDFEMGEVQEITVGGETAVMADIAWVDDGEPVAGRAVAIHMDGWGIVIQGAGATAGWEPFIPTFEAMLASLEIYEPEVAAEPIRQWAMEAEASSQYGDPDWAAAQATGAPDTPECGDQSSAWASSGSSSVEWINLYYETPIYPTEINIVQTYNPDQVSQVDLIDVEGAFITVYTQLPEHVDDPCPYTLFIAFDESDVLAQGVRITVDQSVLGLGWNEIDAVEIVGIPGEGAAVRPGPTSEGLTEPVEEVIWRLGGESGWEEGQFNAISGMDIGPDGDLYVADSMSHISVISSEGEDLFDIEADDLWNVSDVQVTADGTIYAADWGSNAIFVFSADGTLLRQWGQEGTGDGEFGDFSPEYLAVCPDGLVYVADGNEDADGEDYERIQVFDAEGNYLAQWNISEIDDFYSISGMDCGADGNIYLIGFIGGYVMALDPSGTQLAALGEDDIAHTTPSSVAVDPAGNLYVGTWNEGVLLLDPLGNLLGQWGVSTGEEGPRVEGQLHFADGITVDGQGIIYVGDWAGGHSYVTKFVTP